MLNWITKNLPFMGFLGSASGGPQKPAPKRAGQQATRAPDRSQVSISKEVVARKRNVQSEADIPASDWKIISGADGEVRITTGQRKSTVVLELKLSHGATEIRPTASRRAMIISRKDSFGDTGFNEVLRAVENAGYKVTECGTADSGFIAKLYEGIAAIEELQLDPEAKEYVDIIDNDLILRALERGTSDIHIELREGGAEVKFRIDGVLVTVGNWAVDKTERVERVLFTLADHKTKDTTHSEDRGQSMSIKRVVKGMTVKLRFQSESAYPSGKDIVMRVLPEGKQAQVKTPEELGFALGHVAMIKTMLSVPNGAIIIAGVTGSGKSTSLQTFMYDIRMANSGIKMYSIEDPPEYLLKGVTQIPVRTGNGKGGNPYAETMRNAMRMDPDVLMVGELRDADAVSLLTSMVQSGHKVLTTIHAPSAWGIMGRINKMGLDFGTLGERDFISGLIYQKLVPKLCTQCRKPYSPLDYGDYTVDHERDHDRFSPELIEQHIRKKQAGQLPVLGKPGMHERIARVDRSGSTIYVSGDGCEHCNGGRKGRTVCAEVVLLSSQLRSLVSNGDINTAYTKWSQLKKLGSEMDDGVQAMAGMTALDHAIFKVRTGLVSPIDVEDEMGFLTGYEADEEIMGESAAPNFGF